MLYCVHIKQTNTEAAQMIDCRDYSENELALHVLNDEYFMSEIGHTEYLLALVSEEFQYTPEQHDVLVEALGGMTQ
jgi:hypothetical protein